MFSNDWSFNSGKRTNNANKFRIGPSTKEKRKQKKQKNNTTNKTTTRAQLILFSLSHITQATKTKNMRKNLTHVLLCL